MIHYYKTVVLSNGKARFPAAFTNVCNDFNGCTFRDVCLSAEPESWYDEYERAYWDPINVKREYVKKLEIEDGISIGEYL